MDATELRLGNSIFVNRAHGRGPKQKKIKKITIYQLTDLVNGLAVHVHPIPITHELLIERGFKRYEKGNGGYVEYIKYLNDTRQHDMKIYTFEDSDREHWENGTVYVADSVKRMKYLHQLENAYYVFTNKELNL